MSKRLALILVHIGAFWPVWIWYASRLVDRSDEPWGIVALITIIIFVFCNKRLVTTPNRIPGPSIILLLFYVVALPYLSPLARACLAVSSLSFTVSSLFLGRAFHLGIFGLAILSLPIIASLQFYLGFPIRLLTTKIVAHALTFIGYPTAAIGTCLGWAGELIAIDAPCSGIKLLWCALYVSFSIATFKGFSLKATWLLYFFSSILVFCTNCLRTLILFFFEAGIFSRSIPGYHTGVGLILSVALIFVLLSISTTIQNKHNKIYA